MSLQNPSEPTSRRVFRPFFALLLCTLLAGSAWYFLPAKPHRGPGGTDLTEEWHRKLPTIARTPGGLLELATMTAPEDFTSGETTYCLGIYLGTTKAAMQVGAVFRYHVPLNSPEWSVSVRGPLCLVTAPDVAPSLPVCFDSAKVRTSAENGWARWNKVERLEDLRASVTAELGKRASDPEHLALAREACRRTVAEFVTRWLVREQDWRNDPDHQVVVRFQSEIAPDGSGRP